jgi:hypothetical protein
MVDLANDNNNIARERRNTTAEYSQVDENGERQSMVFDVNANVNI